MEKGTLSVNIFSASGLPGVDATLGTSDPFCEMGMVAGPWKEEEGVAQIKWMFDHKGPFKTEALYSTCNPSWGEEPFELHVYFIFYTTCGLNV